MGISSDEARTIKNGIAALVIEAVSLGGIAFQTAMTGVSKAEALAYLARIDQQLDAIEERIKELKAIKEWEARLKSPDSEG